MVEAFKSAAMTGANTAARREQACLRDSLSTDIVADMRLFADLRKAATDLKGLNTLDKAKRAAAARDSKVYQAVWLLGRTVEQITGVPLDDKLFWDPQREAFSAAEKRFDKLRKELSE